MRAANRLSAQRRIFELQKAIKQEMKEAISQASEDNSETPKEVYGRQQSKRS